MKDFFISYTIADRNWAEWIAWELEEAGYSVIIQSWDFAPGCDFVSEMDEALKVADRVILVLSKKYFDSPYTKAEWTSAYNEVLRKKREPLIPFRIENFEIGSRITNFEWIVKIILDITAVQLSLRAAMITY